MGRDYYIYFNGEPVRIGGRLLIMFEDNRNNSNTESLFGFYEQSKATKKFTKRPYQDADLAQFKNRMESPTLKLKYGKNLETEYKFENSVDFGITNQEIYVDQVFRIIHVESILYKNLTQALNSAEVRENGEGFSVGYYDDEGKMKTPSGKEAFVKFVRGDRYIKYMNFVNDRRTIRRTNTRLLKFYRTQNQFVSVSIRNVNMKGIFNPIFDDLYIKTRFLNSRNIKDNCFVTARDLDITEKKFEKRMSNISTSIQYLKEVDFQDEYKIMYLTLKEVSELLEFDWKLPLNSKVACALVMGQFIDPPTANSDLLFASFKSSTYGAVGDQSHFVKEEFVGDLSTVSPEDRMLYSEISRAQALFYQEIDGIQGGANINRRSMLELVGDMKEHVIGGLL